MNQKVVNKLKAIERRLSARLEEIRSSFGHAGVRGDHVERDVREFLRSFLPVRNRVGHGEIIDSFGGVSKQADVIITNEFHPCINEDEEPGIFFVEGVACVGEVKTHLTDLEDTLEKCARSKELRLNMIAGAKVNYDIFDFQRYIKHKPFFLLAFESSMNLKTLAERICNHYNSEGILETAKQLDCVVVLDRGVILNQGSGQGAFKLTDAQGVATGLIPVERQDRTLLLFLAWLTSAMPHIRLNAPVLIPYLMDD